MADSVIFYQSFYTAITGSGLTDAEQLTAFKAIFEYSFYGTEPELEGLPFGIFTMARESIDANTRKRESGRNGGRPRKKTIGFENVNHRFPKSESTDTVTDTVTGTVTDTVTGTVAGTVTDTVTGTVTGTVAGTVTGTEKPPAPARGKRFTPPVLDEVRAYCQERGNSVDAQRFIDYYTARGWRIGNNSMRDWKAAVRTWESREGVKAPAQEDYSW